MKLYQGQSICLTKPAQDGRLPMFVPFTRFREQEVCRLRGLLWQLPKGTWKARFGNMETFFLEASRLGLRPHSYSDVEFMIELNSDPEVVRYTGNSAFGHPDEAREVVASLIEQFSQKKMGRLIVADLNSGERLGWCGLKWHEEEQVADLGYRFLKRHWRKGFATEAARACLAYGFETLRLPKIVAHAKLENAASVRVLEKLGFTRTGPTRCDGLDAEGFLLLRENYVRSF